MLFGVEMPRGVGNLCPHKSLHMAVYTDSCHKLEITKMVFSKWVDKLWCIKTTEYYSFLKGNELLSWEKSWGKLESILLKKSIWKCYIPEDTLEKGKTGETTKRSVVARSEARVERPGLWEISVPSKQFLCGLRKTTTTKMTKW